ncbi:Galactose-1-phosphate uridylyltransferase [invertebrate metagenome]|uniref:UDP-glucose--hexose-1-phosphate uridylyltransferase n=1 Tax=invertebrate metagenome TaxID=1711999 RepID=A0A2H9TCJ2_9ZZZZ
MNVDNPHRRYNPLREEWVLVSPHRADRPWSGQLETSDTESKPSRDPECYLCPGNQRVHGEQNPDYEGTYLFPNDFPALLEDSGLPAIDDMESSSRKNRFFQKMPVRGVSKVICFSPDHSKTLPRLSVEAIAHIIDLWAQQVTELGKDYLWVQLFENKGAMMGCSNPHPHGQIWATSFIPNEIYQEDHCQQSWQEKHDENLLLAYARQESESGERTVVENKDWIAVVPYWAVWPFETLLLPKNKINQLSELLVPQRYNLAVILKQLTTCYDNLFYTSFPYSMGWHGAPLNGKDNDHWQLHAHFYPPLLRSATVRKFMVGFEMLAESQRDLTAEQAASRLRETTGVHYMDQRSV